LEILKFRNSTPVLKYFDIDFLIFDDKVYFVNATYILTDDNFEREVVKLAKASKKYNIESKLIYYENHTKYDSFEDVEFVRFDEILEWWE